MKQAWWQAKLHELQNSITRCDIKSFYQNLRSVFGPVSRSSAPIISNNGNLPTDEKVIRKRWVEHSRINNLPRGLILDGLPATPSIVEIKGS